MLRAIIIDDEQKGINSLKMLISEFIQGVKVVADTCKAGEAIELIENYKPEIVFLDINMPEMNGFELLEQLSWKNFNLVFVTAHEEYALQALKNNAIDYLLKPLDPQDLEVAIDRIRTKIMNHDTLSSSKYAGLINELNPYNSNKNNKILVNLRSGIESIDLSEIVCLESQSNYTQIHLADGKTILASKSLRDFEEQLCIENTHFMRVHHSFIINIHKVARYLKSEECIVMLNNKQIPLSKSRRETFYSWLNL